MRSIYWVRSWAGFVCAGAVFALASGCAAPAAAGGAPGARENRATAAAPKLTPSTDVGRVQAWKDAEMVSSLGQGRASAVGAGESMQPIYSDNTVLVITKIAYEDLKAGMSVAYMNRRGNQVVHHLLAKDALGWRVQGFNNEVEDRDRVTRDNLVGVVYASFSAGEEL